MRRVIPAALLISFALAASEVSIRMNGGAFQVIGWKAAEPMAGWASIFTVSTGSAGATPMLGTYSVEQGILTFRTRWPIAAGLHVHASFHPPGAPAVEAGFATPKAEHSAVTRIAHVYPSASELPSNALRLYIYFTAPMQRGEAWQRIHLLDETGARAASPFLEIDQELWDPGNTRLTVLFDPGRIKRGLAPLREDGPNLVEGRNYVLVIDRGWEDARGQPLAADFRKPIHVLPADREPIDPARWRISTPSAGGSGALVVAFPKPLDYALLQRMLWVAHVKGTIAVARDETEWRFTPDEPWKTGAYELVVNTVLEDAAGNRVGRPFDVDKFTEVTKEIRSETVSVPFRVGDH